jgi:general bacterial porin, GBP family
MKKNLIALAIFGAFSGAALAQSNVTLYGIIDVGYRVQDPETGSKIDGIDGGNQSGNRFGIRGSEAISPNLNAVFTIEGGFSIDTGTLGQATAACAGVPIPAAQPQNSSPCTGTTQTRLFGRQAWGGLAGNWGTVVAGRTASFSSGTGSFSDFGNVDPFGTGFNGMGGLIFSSAGGSGSPLRMDNTVLYQSPTWGGFKFGTGYSFNASGSENASNNVDIWFSGVSFAIGPFWAGVTYDVFDIPGAGSDQKNLQLGATFDLKFLKIHGGYAKEDDQRIFNALGITSGADADAWMLGVSIPLFGGSLFGSYQEYDGDRVTLAVPVPVPPAAPAFDERDMKIWAIGYTYPLSRRTNLYAAYGDNDAKETINNTALDRKSYSIGIRHLF